MSIAHTLSVVGQDVGIHLPIRKALIALERSYLNDTFITIPNFKQEILEIENNQFSIQLLKNTYGSFYRLVLLGDMDTELLNCFIIMPDQDCNLQDLSLLTAYPEIEISITATSFLQLSDVPKSYIGQAGKVLAVKQDGSGLEFIECTCNDDGGGVTPPLISCVGATSSMSFSHIAGDWNIYMDDDATPTVTGGIGEALSQLLELYSGKLAGDYDGVMYIQNIDNIPHRLRCTPIFATSFTPNLEENPTFVADDNGGFYFCLGQQKALISCDGATNSVVFEEDPDFTSWGSIDSIVINDTEYAKPESIPEGELLPLNPTPDGDQIRISIDGGYPYQKLMFENLGARPARVKLKTKQDWLGSNLANANLHSSNDNPTVVGDGENFEVHFCLAILS